MLRRLGFATAFAAALVAGGVAFATPAHANNVGFSVSVGVPGFAATVGNVPYGYGYAAPYYRPYRYHYHYRPYVAAPVVYPPVVYPAPYVAPAPVVVPQPYYGPYNRPW